MFSQYRCSVCFVLLFKEWFGERRVGDRLRRGTRSPNKKISYSIVYNTIETENITYQVAENSQTEASNSTLPLGTNLSVEGESLHVALMTSELSAKRNGSKIWRRQLRVCLLHHFPISNSD